MNAGKSAPSSVWETGWRKHSLPGQALPLQAVITAASRSCLRTGQGLEEKIQSCFRAQLAPHGEAVTSTKIGGSCVTRVAAPLRTASRFFANAWSCCSAMRRESTTMRSDCRRPWRRASRRFCCQQALNKILSIPLETRRTGLADVPATLAAMKGLKEERDILIGTSITPYVS